jgi:xanthine dehydrogenase YagS FAD-binding subunit
MKNFAYYRPSSAQQAVGLLENRWGSTELLAGGTDLHDLQKEYVAQPDKVISLGGLGKDFRKISSLVPPGAFPPIVTIGAGATLADIAGHRDIRSAYAAVATAAGMVGGPQIRNMGTLGGNLCQRNRCWYFRDEHVDCLLKTGRKCFATDGENVYHAVFTKGHPCVIVHPSTVAPALIACGATAAVLGPKGERKVEVAKLFRAPKANGEREHTLEPNEMILSVTISAGTEQFVRFHSASYEVRHKQSYDWPLVQAAVGLPLKDGKITGARIVLGHVAPTPIVVEAAARSLEGKTVSEETASAAGKACVADAKPLSQNGYKLKLIEVAVKRAVLLAGGVKPYWEATP